MLAKHHSYSVGTIDKDVWRSSEFLFMVQFCFRTAQLVASVQLSDHLFSVISPLGDCLRHQPSIDHIVSKVPFRYLNQYCKQNNIAWILIARLPGLHRRARAGKLESSLSLYATHRQEMKGTTGKSHKSISRSWPPAGLRKSCTHSNVEADKCPDLTTRSCTRASFPCNSGCRQASPS